MCKTWVSGHWRYLPSCKCDNEVTNDVFSELTRNIFPWLSEKRSDIPQNVFPWLPKKIGL